MGCQSTFSASRERLTACSRRTRNILACGSDRSTRRDLSTQFESLWIIVRLVFGKMMTLSGFGSALMPNMIG